MQKVQLVCTRLLRAREGFPSHCDWTPFLIGAYCPAVRIEYLEASCEGFTCAEGKLFPEVALTMC